jgi:hypothetical protein
MRDQYFCALGYRCDPYGGGYYWHDEIPSSAIIEAVEALPEERDTFLLTDLETDPAAQALNAMTSQERFLALKQYQCHLIRELRAAAYKVEADGEFFQHEADGAPRETWSATRAQIKGRYPWPGMYR